MNVFIQAMLGSKQQMGRFIWAVIAVLVVAFLLSITIDYGKPFIEFIYFVTS